MAFSFENDYEILWGCNRIKYVLPDLIVNAIVQKMLGV
jgi:hypothetical protein